METWKNFEKKLPDAYKLIIIALAINALVNASAFGYDKVILSAIIAVAVAQAVDIALTYLKTKKFIYANSATISALIITNIIMPGQFLLLGVMSATAMILKHIIRFEKKPVFNPAASAGLVVPLLFAATGISVNVIENMTGWGNSTLGNILGTVVIIVFGLLVSARIKRLASTITYLVGFAVMTLLTFGMAGLQYFPFFGAFFMFTEPRTTPAKTKHQIIFGIAPLVFTGIYMMFLPVFYAFSLAFLSANLVKIGLEKSKI